MRARVNGVPSLCERNLDAPQDLMRPRIPAFRQKPHLRSPAPGASRDLFPHVLIPVRQTHLHAHVNVSLPTRPQTSRLSFVRPPSCSLCPLPVRAYQSTGRCRESALRRRSCVPDLKKGYWSWRTELAASVTTRCSASSCSATLFSSDFAAAVSMAPPSCSISGNPYPLPVPLRL